MAAAPATSWRGARSSPCSGLGIPVTWRSRTWHEPATRRLRFVHVAGATKGMDVTWTIEPAQGGTRVEIEHDFHPRVPVLARSSTASSPADRGRTLATFKAIAEALAVDEAGTGRRRPRPTTVAATR